MTDKPQMQMTITREWIEGHFLGAPNPARIPCACWVEASSAPVEGSDPFMGGQGKRAVPERVPPGQPSGRSETCSARARKSSALAVMRTNP